MNISTKLLVLVGAMGVSLSTQAITFDGKYDGAGPYSKVFNFAYKTTIDAPDPLDPNNCGKNKDKPCLPLIKVPVSAPGGILAFGTDAQNKQYVFFSHPLGFKDNSWGTTAVGWDGNNQSKSAAMGSEHFGFWLDSDGQLKGAANNYTSELLVRVEYDHPIVGIGASSAISGATGNPTQGGNGVEVKGGAALPAGTAGNVKAVSTAQYNADQRSATPGVVGSGVDANLPTNSPAVKPGCAQNDSSGTSLTNSGVNNTGCYEVANAADSGWVFNAGVELQFSAGYFNVNFNDLQVTNANAVDGLGRSTYAFNYFDFRAQLSGDSFAIAHASPAKIPGVLELITDDTTQVPEPESLALFLLGLMVMRRQLRRGRVAASAA